ncbi:MAG: hypothetical protein R3E54_14295 [Halioglobus sp.]
MLDDNSHLAAELEKARQELVQMRRDLVRWKIQANEYKARIEAIESSASWRWTLPIRLLPAARRQLKPLLILLLVLIVTLPVWPLLLLMMVFRRSRDFLWSVLWRITPLRGPMSFLRQRLLAGPGPTTSGAAPPPPLVFRRPTNALVLSAEHKPDVVRWHLMQQLCPHRRAQLEQYRLTRVGLINELESVELQSLSRTELNLLRIAVTAGAPRCVEPGAP